MSPASTNELLRDRARMLGAARQFFAKRNVLEVDCCALSPFAAIDVNIDVISADVSPTTRGYLHTSPEYAMKRLLAAGSGDIYFLGHVFRQGEIGRLHNPEFTMAEWYRIGMSFETMIEETAEFIQLFLGKLPVKQLSYRKAFELFADVNYTSDDLFAAARRHQLQPDPAWSRSTLQHFLLTHVIEPKLGINRDGKKGRRCASEAQPDQSASVPNEEAMVSPWPTKRIDMAKPQQADWPLFTTPVNNHELTVLTDYPPSEAALARIVEKDNEPVAERFEIYFQGVELCNGYHELPDGHELRRRFTTDNLERVQAGKPAYALDEAFLGALGPHFPDCCGVSVGIDRLLLLRNKRNRLSEVLPFAWGH